MAEIKGLTLFRDRFADHKDKYILIGGCALHTVMSEAALPVRATKDLDIVLVVEAIDPSFGTQFWQFVEEGGYAIRQVSQDAQRNFYRFQKPTTDGFPAMLELFSRDPGFPKAIATNTHLTPIPLGEEVESLSAILLDADYYAFILSARRELLGLPYVGEECLIALKALAWLDLRDRRNAGKAIDSKNIRKHLMDVLALSQVLGPDSRFEASPRIVADIARFIEQARVDDPDVSRFGASARLPAILERIQASFVAST